MKNLITVVLLCAYGMLHSQQVSRSTHASTGGHQTNDQGYTLEWTLGGQFSQVTKKDHHVTEGFQQGDLDLVHSAIQKREKSTKPDTSSLEDLVESSPYQIVAYPNPCTEQLYLDIDQENFQGASLQIFDINGKQVGQQSIDSTAATRINIKQIHSLAPGQYLLRVSSPQSPANTLSFIKLRS